MRKSKSTILRDGKRLDKEGFFGKNVDSDAEKKILGKNSNFRMKKR